MHERNINVSEETLRTWSQRWQVRELALFGSVLRPDFRPDSDVDILVSFTDTAQWGLFAQVQMQQELEHLLGRPVDLVSRRAIEASTNWLRREAILSSAITLYSDGTETEVSHVT